MHRLPHIIALTGGIGSGKSVVSRLLQTMGYVVYDCDRRAKTVMTSDQQLREQLTDLFGPNAYLIDHDGQLQLNKPLLSQRIFTDATVLSQMNACVHPAVARDLLQQAAMLPSDAIFFFESAILYESGFDRLVPPDDVWTVIAPLELRIERAMQRDGASREKILSRIGSQMPQEEKERRASAVILNDDRHSLILQVHSLLNSLTFLNQC